MSSKATEQFARDVARGLARSPKTLDCMYLYDERGSALFEDICEQPEYYLTRTESQILQRHADEIARQVGPANILELGSGSSTKTHHLLRAATGQHDRVRYVPVDVSASALESCRESIDGSIPSVAVTPVVGTYDDALALAPELRSTAIETMVVFLGSTLGNFSDDEFDSFWDSWAKHMSTGDKFLLGVDLHKDTETLEAAYNDAAGVTAKFTRNLFVRINRELGAEIDLETVEHIAHYVEERRQIEIFARFNRAQEINLPALDQRFAIDAGELIHTEVSRKFELDRLQARLDEHGFETIETFTDDRDLFANLLLERHGRAA